MADSFRKGNIFRIYMKDFLTYDEIEIHPKPHLNVIIGPNATGKSSIFCGICIGLGGKPELTGRGKSLVEYVKQGKTNSIIEIELYNNKGDNYIIRREFTNQSNSSRWFLQNKEIREKDIEACVAKLGIQVNNLCQFLPQERVTEFARMNKIELLCSTEKAVGEMELFKQHEILSKYGKTVLDLNSELTNLRSQLTGEIKKNDQLEDQVKNIKLKENLDKSIKELKQLIVYINYNETFRKRNVMQASVQELENACQMLEARMEPNKVKINKIDQKIKQHLELVKKQNEESNVINKKLNSLSNSYEHQEEIIVIAKEEFRNLGESSRKREREIGDLKKQLEVLLSQLSEVQHLDEISLMQEIKFLTGQISSKSQNLGALQQQTSDNHIEMNALHEEFKHKEKQLMSLRDIKSRRLQILQTKNRAVYAATLWLRSNKNLFRGVVHEPLFSVIDCLDESVSKYLENIVSNQDLVAFVCEEKADVKTLKMQANANRWPINILYSAPVDPSSYVSRHPIEKLRSLGFQNYVRDVVTAPPAVLSFMCRNYNIYNIPFAQNADYERVPKDISVFFIGQKRYSSRQSRYDGQWSTNVSDLKAPAFLTLCSDPRDEAILQSNLEKLQIRLSQFQSNLQNLQVEENKIEIQLEKLRTEKREKMMHKDQRKQLQMRVNQKQEQITRREQDVIDLQKAEEIMHAEIKKAVIELLTITRKMSQLEESVTTSSRVLLDESFEGFKLNQKKIALVKSMEDEESQKKSKMEERNKLKTEVDDLKDKASVLLNKFTEGHGVSSYKDIPPTVITAFNAKASQTTLDEVKDDLAEKEARRNCIITSDDNILLEYNRRKERIRTLQCDEEKVLEKINNEKTSVEHCRNSWVPQIESLTSKINEHFSNFMSKLECAGEVQLDKDDENDFSQYGLQIRVKFRDTEKLKELTAQQQSGGERSVSTALYLMALQTLTAVPFRCVDEINQGMDPTNERKMFTMLVQSTTTEHASQYFLITPKLLPNLPYNKFVNFMNIYNWSTNSKIYHLDSSKMLMYHKKKERHNSSRT